MRNWLGDKWSTVRHFFKDHWYDLKCFFWHRYRTVKPTSLPGHGWVDRDELMLHCAFQCLVDFVEKEERPNPCQDFETYKRQWGDDDERSNFSLSDDYLLEKRKVDLEILALYNWWKVDYLEIRDTLRNDTYEEINKMFHRLVEIRGYLWT
jgi:hypothetical protein